MWVLHINIVVNLISGLEVLGLASKPPLLGLLDLFAPAKKGRGGLEGIFNWDLKTKGPVRLFLKGCVLPKGKSGGDKVGAAVDARPQCQ